MLVYIILLITGLVGLVVISIMISSYKSNQLFNIYLMLIFLMVTTRFLIYATYGLNWQGHVKPTSGLFLAIIPSFYLYYKNILNLNAPLSFKGLYHYIAVIVFYVVHKVPFLYASVYWGSKGDLILMFLFTSIYAYSSFKLLNTKLWSNTTLQIAESHYKLVKNWTIYLFSFTIIGSVFFVVSIFNEYIRGEILGAGMPYHSSICWLFIFAKLLLSPQILFGLPILNKKLLKFTTAPRSRLNSNWLISSTSTLELVSRDQKLETLLKDQIFSYASSLDLRCTTDLVFRNNKFKLSDLASLMKVPESHLVYLFKYHSKCSFSEYRTQCRIADTISLIHENYLKINTYEALALKVGFSSYNPFYTSFKKHTNFTPKEFVLKYKKTA